MEEKNNMTAERSLEIIRESIERSQRTINKNSAIPLIWWGACVVAFSLFIAYLWKNHGGPAWNMLWAILWLVGYAGNWLIDKRRESVPTTFVGKTIGHVWATFGVFCCGVGMIFGFIGSGMLPMELIMPSRHPKPRHSGVRSCSGHRRILRSFALLRSCTTLCDGCRGLDWSNRARCNHSLAKPEIRRTSSCSNR